MIGELRVTLYLGSGGIDCYSIDMCEACCSQFCFIEVCTWARGVRAALWKVTGAGTG